jgi:ribonuclease D
MTPELPPPTVVTDARGLDRLLDQLDRHDEIAFDTEADSFYSYKEKVCLIQVTAGEQDWLVDPLAGFDLAPLGEVFADPSRRKVFHDGEYDVLLLKRTQGFAFANLFDTRVAAAVLGSTSPGLASTLHAHFGLELDKSQQRSNWAQRPLSPKQLKYAQIDTHYLLPLMREQVPELERRDRRCIVDAECVRLERIEPPVVRFDADEYARLKGARALGALERQVLRELFALRERLAQDADEPPFRIVNNEVLVEIARLRPRRLEELQRVPGFSGRQVRLLGGQVLAAIARAEELGPLHAQRDGPPRDGEVDEQEAELHERLKAWRRDEALEMGIDAAYLLNRHVLARIARERPRDAAALERIEGIAEWQLESLGAAICDVVGRFEADVRAGAVDFRRRRPRRG